MPQDGFNYGGQVPAYGNEAQSASYNEAKLLYDKYCKVLNIRDMRTAANPFAKECALIAVEQILNAPHCWQFIEGEHRIFWNKVKQHIENL